MHSDIMQVEGSWSKFGGKNPPSKITSSEDSDKSMNSSFEDSMESEDKGESGARSVRLSSFLALVPDFVIFWLPFDFFGTSLFGPSTQLFFLGSCILLDGQ